MGELWGEGGTDRQTHTHTHTQTHTHTHINTMKYREKLHIFPLALQALEKKQGPFRHKPWPFQIFKNCHEKVMRNS